jgi:hypothetical protein
MVEQRDVRVERELVHWVDLLDVVENEEKNGSSDRDWPVPKTMCVRLFANAKESVDEMSNTQNLDYERCCVGVC